MKKLLILLVLVFSACSEMYVVPEDHYLIKAGKHESQLSNGMSIDKLSALKTNRLMFTARFDESARYDLGNNDHFDINKLLGFSEANQHHHKNSVRFGWRYNLNSEKVEIFSYVYKDSELEYDLITDVSLNVTLEYQINLFDNSYEFVVDGITKVVERNAEQKVGVYYKLYPYFGGDEPAPHDISIFIKEGY